MCEDMTCGICGKLFYTCRHYRKSHLPNDQGQALCQRRNVVTMEPDWRSQSIDFKDVCRDCFGIARLDKDARSYEAVVYDEFEEERDALLG